MTRKLVLCSCDRTLTLDPEAIGGASGWACTQVHDQLCGHQQDVLAGLLAENADVVIACAQETETFAALAEEIGVPEPATIDLRDRAGWSADPASKTPKIAALLALEAVAPPPEKTRDVVSEGLCLVLGPSEVVREAAERLAGALSVTCVVTDDDAVIVPPVRRIDIHRGTLSEASGTLGAFRVGFRDFAAGQPAGRGVLAFGPNQETAVSQCDLIVDLRGADPLFPAPEKRDGYFRADPRDPLAVERVLFDAAAMTGTFEKPLYIAFESGLCAHSRARQTGCTRCLDLCPTGAIQPNGDHVTIDPMICAGCGACAAACPSGAATYDAPPSQHVFRQISAATGAFRNAGGGSCRLLVHDPDHGREMIAYAARLSDGLPADVIPLEAPALAAFGHAEIMVALASGCQSVDILTGPKSDREAIAAQIALADAMAEGLSPGPGRVRMLEPVDPDALCEMLREPMPEPFAVAPVLALGGRRDATRLAARALADETDRSLPLPAGAPYGAVVVDTEKCTLCLSCVSLCPSGALLDNEDKPQLRFQEDACLQCGICKTVCPETAITLEPRLNLSDAALSGAVLNEEEPFPCTECGALFGVRSTIERIVAKLEGVHPMFSGSDNARLIRMCDNCRIEAQYHSESAPFFAGQRPPTRTTADYLKDEE